eukprot:TRINITY_DN11036_c0_g1_i1.p1 TRINITY_DN11036_c0_g1~~TRINITY_DN11036_c0_g1_i1.p1  ORF type:complete len:457 (+),score=79.97 TRINITY_DN11036_c0_g1_i1:2-1372(+)
MAERSSGRALLLALPAMVNQAASPISILIETAFVGQSAQGVDSRHRLAAYGAVQSTITFSSGLFTFLLSVTLAQVSKAIGQKAWQIIGEKLRLASLVALLSSFLACGILLMLQDPILGFLGLNETLRQLAYRYFLIRAAGLPLVFIFKVGQGVLTGFKAIHTMCAISVVGALVETIGAYVLLIVLDYNLDELAYVTVASYGIMVLLVAVACVWHKPDASVRLCGSHPPSNSESTPLVAGQAAHPMSLGDYLSAAGNIALRSIVLQLSLYGLTIAAGRIDPAALAANAIAAQLWAVTSYLCDGFADVGTMLGGDMYGRGDYQSLSLLARQLIVYGAVTGLLAAAALGGARRPIQELFTHDDLTLHHLNQGLWSLVVGMQPVNSLVFVYDGLLYAVQAFAFKRNIVAAGGIFVYLPTMLASMLTAPSLFLAWVAYAGLTAVRFLGAAWQFAVLVKRAR